MLKHMKLKQSIDNLSKGDKTFAEFLDYMLHGKLVEVYVGDMYETINTEQVSTDYPSVYCGIIEGAYGSCLILNCAYIDEGSKSAKFGHRLFLNQYAIMSVNEITGVSSMEHMLIRSRETLATIKLLDTLGTIKLSETK